MAASHPPAVPAPNWRGVKKVPKRANPNELTTLEARRLKVNPITIGRIPPAFLSKANRRPPKKDTATSGGQRPDKIALMRPVQADKKSEPPVLQPISDFK